MNIAEQKKNEKYSVCFQCCRFVWTKHRNVMDRQTDRQFIWLLQRSVKRKLIMGARKIFSKMVKLGVAYGDEYGDESLRRGRQAVKITHK